MTEFQIPQTIQEVGDRLAVVERLLTSTEWERAAIVYAFTRDEMGRGDKVSSSTDFRLPIVKFAALGFHGLRSDSTVRIYRKAWQTAIDEGKAEPVGPGANVITPDMQWPPTDARTGDYAGRIVSGIANAPVEQRAEILSKLTSDPEVMAEPIAREAIVESAAKSPTLTSRVINRAAEVRPAPTASPRRVDELSYVASLGVGSKAKVDAKRWAEDVADLVRWVRTNREQLTELSVAAISEDADNMAEVAEIARRFAAEIRLALGGTASDDWLRSVLNEVQS